MPCAAHTRTIVSLVAALAVATITLAGCGAAPKPSASMVETGHPDDATLAAPTPPSPAEIARLNELASMLDRVEEMTRRGRTEAERLGEPKSDPEWVRSEGGAFAEAWVVWDEHWRDDVWRIRQQLGDAPGDSASVGLRFAYDHADRALRQLKAVPQSGEGRWNVPVRREWELGFTGVEKQIRDGRFWIDRARRGLGV